MLLRHVLNYTYNFMIVAGASLLAAFNRDDAFWHLGCYASIIFGFMLRMNQIRKKQVLSATLIFWNVVATSCICWLAYKLWVVKFKTFDSDWYQVYLFLVSFFAVIISENIDALGKHSIREWRNKLAKKLYLPTDKEDIE